MTRYLARILSRPIGVLVAAVAVVVMGAISFLNIPVQMLPEGFEERHITVRARLRDSSPAEAERHVAVPIEEGLGTVGGIESLASRCDRDSVRVSIELKSDADATTVERDVRDRVRRVEADLPDEVTRVDVRREGANDVPIVFFACIADTDRMELSDFVEDVIVPRIEAVDGVARASAFGLLRRAVRIQLDPEEVSRRQIDLRQLLRRLRGDNLSMDLGDVDDGDRKAYLRAAMEFHSLDEIREFPVEEGLQLQDLAKVEVQRALDQGWARYNGNAVIVGTVYKKAGANTVRTCELVQELFEELPRTRHEVKDLKLRAFFDQGATIEKSLATLYENALYGAILAVFILYAFFRRLRMTLLVATAIPLSLTIAVTVLYLGGQSLNIATLMGLTLAVGMLIDNAIVVVEAILRRRELGDPPPPAAANGAGEVALAVVTATLTTIAVFLPTFFVAGSSDARVWLGSIGGPIGYSLLASLAVALVLVPLGSVYLRRHPREAAAPVAVHGEGARGVYGRVLGFVLRRRFAVLCGATLLCASAALPLEHLGKKGARGRGDGPVRIAVRWPRHYTMKEADAAVRRYEEFVAGKMDELELDGMYARFDRYAGFFMVWKRRDSYKPRDEISETITKGWPRIEGVRDSLDTAGSGGKTSVTLEGEDPSVLERTMDLIERRLRLLPSVTETQRERDEGLQELRVAIDPEAVERGDAVPDLIRGMVGWVIRGAPLRDYRMGGHDLPVLVELDPEQAVEASALGALLIPTARGMRPLSTLSRMNIHSAPAAIERRDGRRVAQMQVLGGKDDDEKFHAQVQAILRSTPLPPGVRFDVGGSWEDLEETFSALGKALLLGLILVFLLTGILFESIVLPFAVIFAVPPALVGAFWALYVSGKPMDELSFLGLILLVGIVVNNGIVLIDRVQQHRRDGLPLRAAVRAAGRDRLRPVVMTALTTIAGLLPMAIRKGANDEISYDTLATAVIGGLAMSTLVTLVLVPVVFTLCADLGRQMSRGLRSLLR